tara:strand:+ start:732 stop:935 length:204 start_codon:yes stop_codon:yes gene_type:complete
MDTHTQHDNNNPINQQPETRYCEICDIEESKTYFVDETEICEDCFYSCCGDELDQDIRMCPTCKEHN